LNILIIDGFGAGLDFAIRALEDGHAVKWYIKPEDDGHRSKIGEGFADMVKDWKPHLQWSDMVFLTDNTDFLKELDAYRKKGGCVFGPSYQSSRLELDREFGQGVFQKCGIDTIPGETFDDYDEAIKFVRETGKRYVSKPNGDEPNKALSYVSKDPADMNFQLTRWKELGKLKDSFILQEFVPGVEIAVGGWIGPQGFLPYWLENFEHKKLFNGELGPSTGEMGTIAKYVPDSALADYLLKPCEGILMAMGHIGYIDVAAIMDEHGQCWPLEWTARPGDPTLKLQFSVHHGDVANWMLDLCNGKSSLMVDWEVVAGVVMAIPDFPYSKATNKELYGYPIYHLEDVDQADTHLAEVMMGVAPTMDGNKIVDAEIPVSAGDYVAVFSGCADSVSKAVKKAYKNIGKVSMPNSPFYRTDIGERLKDELPQLQEHGYCKDWVY